MLAGSTAPFLRFTGAPYWCNTAKGRFPGQKLNAVIECARDQAAWSRGSGVEVYGEADSYPRPAYQSHANLIECFDIAMQAEGIRDLKYIFDYRSSPTYEQKYYKLHLRHIPLYEHIHKYTHKLLTLVLYMLLLHMLYVHIHALYLAPFHS